MTIADVRTAMTATLAEIRSVNDAIDAQHTAREWSVAAGSWIEQFGAVRADAVRILVDEHPTITSAANAAGLSRVRIHQILDNDRWTPRSGTRPGNDPLVAALDTHLAEVTALDDTLEQLDAAHTTITVLSTFQQALKQMRANCAAYVTASTSLR